MEEDTACSSKQGTNDTEASGYNRISEENDFVQDVAENITETAPCYIDFDNFIQAFNDTPDLPKFDFDIENNQNVANYSNENTDDASYVNDFDIDALIETQNNEVMVENDIGPVSSTKQENEQHNTDTVMFGKEISNESCSFKETPANNSGSVDTYATEVTNTPNDALTKISKATKKKHKKNKATPPLQYKIEVEIKINAGKVEIEIKTVPKHDVLSEFLNFNKNRHSIEASNSNIGEEKKEATAKQNDNKTTTVYTEIKYKCDMCDSEFSFKMDLMRHVASQHGHKCKECGFRAVNPYRLKLHTRRHTGEKPHACHLCNYTCRRLDMLRRHYLTHTEIKPYICHTCGVRFKSLKYLKQHVRNKCAWFSCTFCPLRFTSVSDLDRHKETHEESYYICRVCGWKYRTRNGLHRHKKVHNTDAVNREGPFSV